MKEIELYKLVTAVMTLGFVRSSLIFQPAISSLNPITPKSRVASLLDGILSRELLERAQSTDRRFDQARQSNLQVIRVGFSKGLSEIIGHLEDLDLPVTLTAAKRLKESVEARDGVPEDKDVGDLLFRLIDELRDRRFFDLSTDLGKMFGTQQFSADVRLKFPSAVVDIDEAINCLALERSTASVFHFMRVMEVAVRATATCLGVPGPVRGADKNWGNILSQVRSAMNTKWPSAADKMLPDAKLFENLFVSLDAVKNGWRNATMHVERTYTMEEAQRVRHAVEGLLVIMAGRFDENGVPPV